jgi:acyl-CoA synthetase (AMP-forming)/AMP-acid ligase II
MTVPVFIDYLDRGFGIDPSATAIGAPDEKWGEAVTAIVELKPGAEGGHFRELPRSTQGKVLKRTLRDEFWAGRERQV